MTLTEEQSQAWVEQVANPLLRTEWDMRADLSESYTPSTWQDLPMIPAADFADRKHPIDGTSYWVCYVYALEAADRYRWDPAYGDGTHAGRIFGDAIQPDYRFGDTLGAWVQTSAFRSYLDDAQLMQRVIDIVLRHFPAAGDGSAFLIPYSDAASRVEDILLPQAPLSTADGVLCATGDISFTGSDDIAWTLIAQVQQDTGSRYGCTVSACTVKEAA